ncbi:MAG: chemotaxis protein MotC [Mesorhizobium sp.]|nr:chemotaxis protein MotC [Mesorhizobium sp.]MBL8577523.1 chemotaxis protein MotC [Mesorhizobium sp.]
MSRTGPRPIPANLWKPAGILSSGVAILCFALPALAAEMPSSESAPRTETTPHAADETTAGAISLQPYQIVRSLELVQDRLVLGDHASQPMQRKLIQMADASFATRDSAHFENELNRRALVVYAMSGGNPVTVEAALPYLGKDDPNRRLGEKILFYVNGKPKEAMQAFGTVDPMAYPSNVGMYVALIKGSMMSEADPANALALLDRARLLAPGTLVEEAALRRSLAVATRLEDAKRFVRLSDQYVRSYLRSPYASQFADAFVAGIVALQATVDRKGIVDIVSLMDPEQQKVIYLRIARRAAIDGLVDLAAFAATQAETIADDPRAELYAGLSLVTSGKVDDVVGKLEKIDRESLSDNDRQLLDAANAIAAGLVAPGGIADAGQPKQPEIRAVGPDPVVTAPTADANLAPEAASAQSRPPAAGTAVDQTVEQAEVVIASTREKLAEIDKLIGEMPE